MSYIWHLGLHLVRASGGSAWVSLLSHTIHRLSLQGFTARIFFAAVVACTLGHCSDHCFASFRRHNIRIDQPPTELLSSLVDSYRFFSQATSNDDIMVHLLWGVWRRRVNETIAVRPGKKNDSRGHTVSTTLLASSTKTSSKRRDCSVHARRHVS